MVTRSVNEASTNGNPNRGAGLLARKREHLRAVRTNGNPNRQGGIAVHGSIMHTRALRNPHRSINQ